MELRIDTSKDSVEDLKRVVEFLKSVIAAREGGAELGASEGLFNMFSEGESSKRPGKDARGGDEFRVLPYD